MDFQNCLWTEEQLYDEKESTKTHKHYTLKIPGVNKQTEQGICTSGMRKLTGQHCCLHKLSAGGAKTCPRRPPNAASGGLKSSWDNRHE